ncbi:uncharacterized protein A1O9_05376 [Exophiala aquamarina CBS 119918]|uniref:Alcohol dehydrogenase n=1 Tax=Exophiala aquamarina CBS 119918 TaxID=1182545 RepID=A0A072PBH8_9EURO|nr:uncharacterized protein A1O9_05376 [Exophiala aquamarina CBS 119918]KEF57459.1 hypothetical protein A1O9_05376 [Exophiala aquamarina CBS 119918]
MSSFFTLLSEKRNFPKPVSESFAGRTILVTGATSGIGLEAAKKLAVLHANKLIITARNESKANAAKKEVEAFVRASSSIQAADLDSQIVTRVLDMGSFASVQAFVRNLQADFPRLDGVVLNAGAIFTEWGQSEDGWENNIHVNALSTFLLGVLLLPLLIAQADTGKSAYRPHLTFVSSGMAWVVNADKEKAWTASDEALEFVSVQKNFPPGGVGGQTQYARSKLILEYAIRQLADSPAIKGADGHPKVIINSTCPGVTKSDLGRRFTSFVFKIAVWIFFNLFSRETEQGANTLLSALLQGEDLHGHMWKNDQKYQPKGIYVTPDGKKLGDKVWRDVRQVTLKADPSTKAYLPA